MGQIEIARSMGMKLHVEPELRGVCHQLTQQKATQNRNFGRVARVDHTEHNGQEVSKITFGDESVKIIPGYMTILEAGEKFGGLVQPVCLHRVQR
jgi:hypothetical protein